MSGVADRLRALADNAERFGPYAVSKEFQANAYRGYADALDALAQIEELCSHWERHDKTDPDEHDRWKKAAVARARIIGDDSRAALASAARLFPEDAA